MTADQQVRRLKEMDSKGMAKEKAAAKAGMDPKTARKYRATKKLPSEMKKPHTWQKREDPFKDVWWWCKERLEIDSTLYAKTLFDALQRRYPGEFQNGQLRTLQRRVKAWRATEGPAKEVYFPQKHEPGDLGASDFTYTDTFGVTIQGQPFEHLLYHFTLTYSNWEWAVICHSESLEALSEGLQESLWQLGGVPARHRTDQMSAAVNHLGGRKGEFTARYKALMSHYGLRMQKTQPDSPHENGDIEKRNGDFKRRIVQALKLRASRDFESVKAYEKFLHEELNRVNKGRSERLSEEQKLLRRLPLKRLSSVKQYRGVPVSKGSTIRVDHNIYSVPSRLRGEKVDVRQHSNRLDIFYGSRKVYTVRRLHGRGKVSINYRHVIDSLVRKPGAFPQYRYQAELFPTSRFRMAWDELKDRHSERQASKRYLEILYMAARESEVGVDWALMQILGSGEAVSVEAVKQHLARFTEPEAAPDVTVDDPDLSAFDQLLTAAAGACS